jgi:cytochrome c oxidase subunit 1
MSESLGKLHFWPSFVFMNLIFMPMFFAGMAGLSRRLADGGASYRVLARGAALQQAVVLRRVGTRPRRRSPFIINFFWSRKHGKPTEANAWHATTLEWSAAPSPPPHGNFAEPPVVHRGPYEYSVPGASRDYTPQTR